MHHQPPERIVRSAAGSWRRCAVPATHLQDTITIAAKRHQKRLLLFIPLQSPISCSALRRAGARRRALYVIEGQEWR